MIKHLLSWATVAILAAACQVYADVSDGEQVDLTRIPFEQLLKLEVATASRLARQVSDSPAAVAIVTADDIKAYGYHSLGDILNSMRGVYITYDRAFQYLGGRGFGRPGDYTGRILVMIDGYATNDNIYNQAYIDNSGLLDTELIERVEYVPGTGSVTYGNNAYFGTINIITRKGRDFGGTQFSAEAFSFGGKKGRATYGRQMENGADVLMSLSYLDSDGRDLFFPEFNDPAVDPNAAVNHGVARNLDYESSKRLFGKMHYENWALEGGYVSRKKGIPTASYDVAFNAYNQYWDANGFLSAKYDTDLGPRLKSSTHAYYGYYLDRGAGLYPASALFPGLWREHNLGEWWGVDAKFVGTWFDQHTLVFGTEYRDDFRMDLRDPAASSHHSRTITSIYLQDEIALSEGLRLNAGARYDYASDLGGNFSPRLALMYALQPQTTVKASYSTAFRMPSAYEKYYTDGAQLPNQHLQPEYVTTTELVLQHEFSPRMRFTGSLYHYHTSDLINDVDLSATTDHFTNAGSSHTSGLELELERHWDNGVRFRTSYGWQRAIDENDHHMINSPDNLANLNLTFPFFRKALRSGLELIYIGSRRTEQGRELGGYTLTNLTFSSERPLHGLDASVSIRNLFDHEFSAVAPGGFVQDTLRMDGRSVWLQLTYDLE